MATSYHAKIITKTTKQAYSLEEAVKNSFGVIHSERSVQIHSVDLESSDSSSLLIESIQSLALDVIKTIESIEIEKYQGKYEDTCKWRGTIVFAFVDGEFVEARKHHSIPALKRHIKIIEQINEIIAAKKAAKKEQTVSRHDIHKDFNPATNTDHARASKVMLEELRADLREVELDMFASKPAILDMYEDNVKKFDGTDCKIAQEYAEMIRSLIEKNRPQEEAQEETKHFYDFVGYMLSEGNADTSQDIRDTINDLIIEYVDECKNSGCDLPVSFGDDVDRWHVANIIQSHLDVEVRYYQERLQKIQKALHVLKEI
ncbi:MAG: hypothetical protein Unbinned627contig1001_13 [Prokaryotic dsDNA virus sp.]|jgi:hypothetical protein|nr:MAG: hypothetical protein Unbinned627contig1001_13 [Prokaryotic dsDNA virus sp.]|tara:strand:+ start:5296 stop:6243 length:948 start_codon:yes stop_codon:yes gene_type:complete